MADLGPIQFQTPEVGSSGADIARESAALAKTGRALANVEQSRRKSIARDEFADAVESVEALDEGEAVLPLPVGDPLVDEMRNNMTRLRHAVEQGSSSLQARAELELKRRLGVLMARFPGSRSQLQNEFSAFARTDAAFDELGLRDTTRKQASATAAADLQDLQGYAWDELGMNPGDHPPGGIIFAEEFHYRSELKQRAVVAGLQQSARSGSASQSAAEKVEDWQAALVGNRNVVYSQMNDVISQANVISNALLSETAEAKQVVQDWNDFGQQRAIQSVETAILGLQQDFLTEVDPFEFSSDEYQGIKSMADATVEHLNRFVEAIKTNNPSAMEKWQSEQIIRQASLREQNPDLDAALLFVETSSELFAPGVWKTIGGEDAILSDAVGVRVQQSVANYIARGFLNGGQGSITPDMSPTQIRRRLANQVAQRRTPYDTVSKREQPEVQSLASNLNHQRNVLSGVTAASTPQGVALQLGDLITTVDKLDKASDEAYDEATAEFFKLAASDGLVEAINKASKDAGTRNVPVALGDAMFEHWFRDEGQDKHVAKLIATSQTQLKQHVPASVFLKADTSKLAEDGTVRYVVDEAEWAKYDPDPLRTDTMSKLAPGKRDRLAERGKQAELDKLRSIADDLSFKVSEQVKGLATIFLARNPQFTELDFERAFADNDYQNIAFVPVEEE